MKFALLVATASALTLRSRVMNKAREGPPCQEIADTIWEHCDANGDHDITWREAKGCGAQPEDRPFFEQIAGEDGRAQKHEFVDFC